MTPEITVSPELALVDPVLAHSEQIASRLDGWLARTEWRVETPAQPVSTTRRTALAAALLLSMLVNGLLTSFLLFGHNDGPTLQPAVPATITSNAAENEIDMPPPNPAVLRQMTSLTAAGR